MCNQVEDRCDIRANADGRHHEAQLADGGVGQHALDVPLRHSDGGGKERRERTGKRDVGHGPRRRLTRSIKYREHAHEQEDTSRNHGRGMNHRAHWCGAFHGVGQPHMQRELRTLADCAEEEQHRNQANRGHVGIDQRQRHMHCRQVLQVGRLEDVGELQARRVAPRIEEHHADEHDRIAHARRHEGLDACLAGTFLLVPEADQKVRAEAHDFPEDEEGDERIGDDQPQHARCEEADVGHEAAVARVLALRIGLRIILFAQMGREGHVACRVDEDHQQQEADHEEHERVGGVHLIADGDFAGAGGNLEELPLNRVLAKVGRGESGKGDGPANGHGDDNAQNGRERADPFVPVQEQDDQQEGHKWRYRHQPRQVEKTIHGITSDRPSFGPVDQARI